MEQRIDLVAYDEEEQLPLELVVVLFEVEQHLKTMGAAEILQSQIYHIQ